MEIWLIFAKEGVMNNSDTKMEDLSHLMVIKHRDTKQYHGAYYQDHLTPSGEHRLLLRYTTNGFDRGEDAAKAINKAFPGMKSVDIGGFEEFEEPPDLPDCAEVTVVHPYDGQPSYVEVTDFRNREQWLNISMSVRQVEILEGRGDLEIESSSGYDPDLSAVYHHYRPRKEGIND